MSENVDRRTTARKPQQSKNEQPLLIRPGARFRCFGDGLCCTDIHALGPISRGEARAMQKIARVSVQRDESLNDFCLAPVTGRCFFLRNHDCAVQHQFGAKAKPDGCRRFPFGLVDTPRGRRVTTEHRCPCRTLGERPPVDRDEARRSLVNSSGKLVVDQVIADKIWLTLRKLVSFAHYQKLETVLLERLARGEDSRDVLGADVLPALHEKSWPVFAAEYIETDDDSTAGAAALLWFGDAMLELNSGHRPPPRTRPWRGSFDRAMSRPGTRRTARAVFNDWLADEIWMFRWYERCDSFDVGRAEMATRLAIAERLQARLVREFRLPEDQAAAEAVMITETATVTAQWKEILQAIANKPSPARPLSVRG